MTGASMHPGGGVFAASGLNTARTVLSDLKPLNRLWRGISR
jgi:phytoene dehydrogenase-like protein